MEINDFEHDKNNGVYWKKDDPVPYCQTCLEAEEKEMHLILNKNTLEDKNVMYECMRCNQKKAGTGNYYISSKDRRDK